MPMKSVCPGCAHEEACGHAEVHACANRVPARWCSCDPLRRAEAERDGYRAKTLRLVCSRIEYFGGGACERCAVRLSGGDASYGYCDTVLREVDGE